MNYLLEELLEVVKKHLGAFFRSYKVKTDLETAYCMHAIAAILKDLVVGEIGELGGELKREVNLRFRKVYRLS